MTRKAPVSYAAQIRQRIQIWRNGTEAARDGKRSSDNPFPNTSEWRTLRQIWLTGFLSELDRIAAEAPEESYDENDAHNGANDGDGTCRK